VKGFVDQNGHLSQFVQRMEASAEHDSILPDSGVGEHTARTVLSVCRRPNRLISRSAESLRAIKVQIVEESPAAFLSRELLDRFPEGDLQEERVTCRQMSFEAWLTKRRLYSVWGSTFDATERFGRVNSPECKVAQDQRRNEAAAGDSWMSRFHRSSSTRVDGNRAVLPS
jgi:hypothetical protein